MTDNNSTSDSVTELFWKLDKGDEISTEELMDSKRRTGKSFVEPDTETCIVFEVKATKEFERIMIAICTENGYHGMLQVFGEDEISVLSKENETNANVVKNTGCSGSSTLDFKDLSIGFQKVGNIVKGTSEMGRAAVVYDTMMMSKWNYVMAVGHNGRIENYIIKHDSGSWPTALGYRDEWGKCVTVGNDITEKTDLMRLTDDDQETIDNFTQ